MNDEIKEILDEILWQFEKYPNDDFIIGNKESKLLLDYINTLQEENEKLKQSLESRLKYSDELDKKIEVIDKAIESIKIMKEKNDMYGTKSLAIDINHLETLLNILQGDDKE